jgi:hypothetical protein
MSSADARSVRGDSTLPIGLISKLTWFTVDVPTLLVEHWPSSGLASHVDEGERVGGETSIARIPGRNRHANGSRERPISKAPF